MSMKYFLYNSINIIPHLQLVPVVLTIVCYVRLMGVNVWNVMKGSTGTTTPRSVQVTALWATAYVNSQTRLMFSV